MMRMRPRIRRVVMLFATAITWNSVLCWSYPLRRTHPKQHYQRRAARKSRTAAAVVFQQVSGSAEESSGEDPFVQAMQKLGYSNDQKDTILSQLREAGLWDDENASSSSSHTLQTVTAGFDTGKAAATLLIQDFGLSPLQAHLTRAALQHIGTHAEEEKEITNANNQQEEGVVPGIPPPSATASSSDVAAAVLSRPTTGGNCFQSLIINKVAQRRAAGVETSFEYGLPRNYREEFPLTAAELDGFVDFMTLPSTDAQSEIPVRLATATTYMDHARLFLGWYWNYYLPDQECAGILDDSSDKENLSIYKIFPSKEKESASCILDFLQWMRSARHISVSYEANLLRGLGKLLKFRFRKESSDNEGDQSFRNLPVLRELRKWHNDAHRRQKVAPRVANEDRKWLSWSEYLAVVQSAGNDIKKTIQEHEAEYGGGEDDTNLAPRRQQRARVKERAIAYAFQKYLILAFFAHIPDRQRTIRELEIGRTFLKSSDQNQYMIKHTPDDYKTGNTYGERPPLFLPAALTETIDEFLGRWRPCLVKKPNDKSNHVFLQLRTGKPLTSDSVYRIVSSVCYHYVGKRTNPHLLRDMIVTHVREFSNAPEQQLEALALLMGHSIAVQRKSYDRRTLAKKVEPAVALLEQVNRSSGV